VTTFWDAVTVLVGGFPYSRKMLCRPNKAVVGSGFEYYIKRMEGLKNVARAGFNPGGGTDKMA
jgi:hypothetical protein